MEELFRQLGHRMQRHQLKRQVESLPDRIILAPGSGPAPPGYRGAIFDYRGVADPAEVYRRLANEPISIGNILDLRRSRPIGEVGLPPDLMLRHAAIVAPSGAGKTSGFIVPWIYHGLRAGFRVIALDVKGDLQDCFRTYAQFHPRLGLEAVTWDYRRPSESRRWYWIDEMKTPRLVEAAAVALIGREPEGKDPYFYKRDLAVLRGMLGLASSMPSPTNPAELVDLLQRRDDLARVLSALPQAHPTVRELEAYLTLDDDQYYRTITGAAEALKLLSSEPDFLAVTERRDLSVTDLLSRPGLFYVGAASDEGKFGVAVASLMFAILQQHVSQRLGARGPHCPVMLVIDEAPFVQGYVDLRRLSSLARSAMVSVVLAMQDVMMFEPDAARSTILGNCATFVAYGGQTADSAEFLSKRLGTRTVVSLTQNDPGPWSPLGHSNTSTVGPVLGPQEIMYPPWGWTVAIVHVKDQSFGITPKPILVDAFRPEFA